MQNNVKVKRRLWKNTFRVFMMGCILLCVTSEITYVKGNGITLPVTYVKKVSDAYPLLIHVTGNVTLSVGNDKLKNGTGKYLLPIDESITITLQPVRGSTLKAIVLNDVNVMDQVENQRLVVKGKEASQSLVVEFQDSIHRNVPNTGDGTKRTMYWILLIASIGSSSYVYSKRKKKEEEYNGKK